MGQGGNGKEVPSVSMTALRSKVLTDAIAKTCYLSAGQLCKAKC
ncbi:MAG: hypothetical protein AB7E42_04345 [Anaerotignaceae bacterium]